MTVHESFLPDFDHEIASTHRLLERVPASDLAWAPHERSFSLGDLAMHLARLVGWARTILDQDFYDLKSASAAQPPAEFSLTDVLSTFDRHAAAVRERLLTMADAELVAPWELRNGAEVLMSMPRITALRRFVLHHLVHHRGQLSVYLRLRNVPLPPLYGPTADERM